MFVTASSIGLVSLVAVAPDAVSTVTSGCTANAAPPVAPVLGWFVNANIVAAGLGGSAGVIGAEGAMPTTGAWALSLPEPRKRASPNEKTPPSAATNQ